MHIHTPADRIDGGKEAVKRTSEKDSCVCVVIVAVYVCLCGRKRREFLVKSPCAATRGGEGRSGEEAPAHVICVV